MSGIALKITSLVIRTVSKPISKAITERARANESFRRHCISFANALHRTDVKLRMNLLGEKKIRVRPLNDHKAIEQGATFISEFFLFSVAGSLIFYEAYRSRKKAADQREALADDIAVLQSEIEYIKAKLGSINIKLDDYKVPQEYKPKYIKINTNEDTHKEKSTAPTEQTAPTAPTQTAQTGENAQATPTAPTQTAQTGGNAQATPTAPTS
ncbi:hypothetical protein KGF56_001608 [Candida oxycetoniae]|uniref:OPA3-like protein n=1 Tax=Candida oxycetoniae TaxID=497107 RepID=A0AAI9WZ67_9ASCO|nr:uncharacterized protein KGF56_001608 [Candida oxycetoniae]KAI3405590.2 hypothetical protein KGF56_001608 [Candida oxycetoniae]